VRRASSFARILQSHLQKLVNIEKAIWNNAFSRGPDMHVPCAMHRALRLAPLPSSSAMRIQLRCKCSGHCFGHYCDCGQTLSAASTA
jgi:hypothetical protein